MAERGYWGDRYATERFYRALRDWVSDLDPVSWIEALRDLILGLFS